MSRVILLLLLWAGLFCPAAAALGAEVPPPSAPSPAVPSCFVLIQVAPDGELTITERLRGFGPSVDRPLSSEAKIYGSLAPFVQESDMEVVSAKVDGKPVKLTLREFDLLEYLMRKPGVVFSREALLQSVWGWDFDGGSRTVDVHVQTLRQKLGDRSSCIETVRGVGYRFTDHVA